MAARCTDDVAKELNEMTKKTAVQMKRRILNEKDWVSIIFFLHNSEAAHDVVNIHYGAAVELSSTTRVFRSNL